MPKRGENIYKRKDGRWEGRYLITVKGIKKYSYVYGKSYKEAKAKLLTKINTHPEEANEFDNMLISQALLFWLEHNKNKWKISTYNKYSNIINNHIIPQIGMYLASDINNEVITEFIRAKYTVGQLNNSGGLSEKTVRGIISVLKSSLSYLDINIPINQSKILEVMPKRKLIETRVLNSREQAELEKFLITDLDQCKLGVILSLYSGMRIGEICALKWKDIDLIDNVIHVERTLQRVQVKDNIADGKTKILETTPKSQSSIRTIPIPDCIIPLLKDSVSENINDYFLTNSANRFVEPRSLENRFKFYLSQASIKCVNFHALRHTFATRCVALGVEIKSLSEMLGHSNVKITLDRYVHPTIETKRMNINKLSLSF